MPATLFSSDSFDLFTEFPTSQGQVNRILGFSFLAVIVLTLIVIQKQRQRGNPLGPSSSFNATFLEKIPGPSGVDRIPLVAKDPLGEHLNLLEAHRKYGPIIRAGPNLVSCADAESVKTLYGPATPFLKTEWYEIFTEKGKSVLFNERNNKEHAQRRRIVANVFSLSSVKSMVPFVRDKSVTFLKHLQNSQGKEIDLYPLTKCFAGDVAFQLSLGFDPQQTERGQNVELVDDLAVRARADSRTRSIAEFLERLHLSFLVRFTPVSVREGVTRILRANRSIRNAISLYLHNHVNELNDDDVGKEILAKIIKSVDPSTGDRFSFEQLVMESRGFILAGSDTTASTLTFALFHIANTPGVWKRLQEELKQNIPDIDAFINDRNDSFYHHLPYLSACINENYRLCPAVPKLLPRYVPSNGVQLHGHTLPAGTTIGVSSYVVHRFDSNLWGPTQDADRFRPERWLNQDANQLKSMKSALIHFSTGSRACLGRHIAEIELYLAIAAICRFTEPIQLKTNSLQMTVRGFFTAAPASHEMKIQVGSID